MPRRLISSDIFTHPVLLKLPLSATVIWIGLICEADGDGRVCIDPKWLKRRLTSSRPRPSLADVSRFTSAFLADDMLKSYNRRGVKYAQITNFHLYQNLRDRRTNRGREEK